MSSFDKKGAAAMFMPACIHSAVETIGGRGGTSPQIFADQLTLSQPGGQVMPATLLLAPPLPRIFRPSYGTAYTVGEFTSFLIHLTMHSMFWVMINKSLNRQAANNKRMASSTFQCTKILSKIDRMLRGNVLKTNQNKYIFLNRLYLFLITWG